MGVSMFNCEKEEVSVCVLVYICENESVSVCVLVCISVKMNQ